MWNKIFLEKWMEECKYNKFEKKEEREINPLRILL